MEAFSALADPTRRRIVELLAERDRDVSELVAEFRISQPAVSQHLKILRARGLVRATAKAQRRIYSLEVAPLVELEAWLGRHRTFWENRIDALETELVRGRRRKES